MGEEIVSSRFSEQDFQEFAKRLRRETELLKSWLEEDRLVFDGPMAGFELEAWLVDREFNPAPVNEEFLLELNDPEVVHELSRFNVEFNSAPVVLGGRSLSRLQHYLEAFLNSSNKVSEKLQAHILMIGILPTLRQGMLSGANMSTSERYLALNEQIFRQRGGRPLELDIRGVEHLKLTHNNVMLEATATSLQIHLSLLPKKALRYFNASLILSAPMVALAANSPFLFGKQLWDETRIAVFEQAVSLNVQPDKDNFPVGRVTLGTGYLEHSIMEVFEENLDRYPPLLPYLFEDPPERLRHFRLHNGTIWRWNRPLVGMGPNGTPHLRLEHRVASAGPSIPDVIANIAFFLGVLHHYSQLKTEPESLISFSKVRENFYQAAREGLDAELTWLDGKKSALSDLLLQELIPLAARGLKKLGLVPSEIHRYLYDILEHRIRRKQNGANWQKAYIQNHGKDFRAMTEACLAEQARGRPVHEWSL